MRSSTVDWRSGRQVIAAARAMAREGLVIGTVGNVSFRTAQGVAITPTRTAYDRLRRRDLALLDLHGAVLAGRLAPSREWPLHTAVYRARPDVGAVVHTHSLHATAWSFRDGEALPEVEELEYYAIGTVSVAPPAPAGSEALARGVVRALARGRAALLAGHGVIAVGDTPAEALQAALVVERQAALAWLLRGCSVAPEPSLEAL
jgi:L-fuculose-phosphate aldolase